MATAAISTFSDADVENLLVVSHSTHSGFAAVCCRLELVFGWKRPLRLCASVFVWVCDHAPAATPSFIVVRLLHLARARPAVAVELCLDMLTEMATRVSASTAAPDVRHACVAMTTQLVAALLGGAHGNTDMLAAVSTVGLGTDVGHRMYPVGTRKYAVATPARVRAVCGLLGCAAAYSVQVLNMPRGSYCARTMLQCTTLFANVCCWLYTLHRECKCVCRNR